MNDDDGGEIWVLAANIAILSLMTIGGGMVTVLPELHRQVVDVHGWITSEQFTDFFAIAQASPGPNMMVVTLIGFQVGGIPGGLLATAAVTAPTCTLAYFASRLWNRFRHARWRMMVQAGLVPVSVGLVAASAYTIAREADTTLVAVVLTIVSAALLTLTRTHPLLLFAAGGILGVFGLV